MKIFITNIKFSQQGLRADHDASDANITALIAENRRWQRQLPDSVGDSVDDFVGGYWIEKSLQSVGRVGSASEIEIACSTNCKAVCTLA